MAWCPVASGITLTFRLTNQGKIDGSENISLKCLSQAMPRGVAMDVAQFCLFRARQILLQRTKCADWSTGLHAHIYCMNRANTA